MIIIIIIILLLYYYYIIILLYCYYIVIVPSGTLSARTGESAKLPVRARLSSFRSLCAVFRGGT